MSRPVIFVLAGVNGAGKSSIGGHLLNKQGLTWFNPDTFTRELMAAPGWDLERANVAAWQEGMQRLAKAVRNGEDFAFETTLGGSSVPHRIRVAAQTHDVYVWFCGLSSAEQHIARVRARVAAGGHDIPETRIRERYDNAQANLIALMPHLAHLQVYDNSIDAAPGESVPTPTLVLEMVAGKICHPDPRDAATLGATPEWAKAIVAAAIAL